MRRASTPTRRNFRTPNAACLLFLLSHIALLVALAHRWARAMATEAVRKQQGVLGLSWGLVTPQLDNKFPVLLRRCSSKGPDPAQEGTLLLKELDTTKTPKSDGRREPRRHEWRAHSTAIQRSRRCTGLPCLIYSQTLEMSPARKKDHEIFPHEFPNLRTGEAQEGRPQRHVLGTYASRTWARRFAMEFPEDHARSLTT